MASVKRPKLKRYPKRPKASASLDAWKHYDQKCRDTEKDNAKRMSDYHKAVRDKESHKKAKETIMKKTKSLKGIAGKKR